MNANKKISISVAIISVIVITMAVCFLPARETLRVYQVPQTAKILFVGDLMFDRGIRYYAEKNGGNEFVFAKIRNLLAENNVVVANLEGPITNNPSKSAGTAPGSANNYYFTFDPSVAKTLYSENIRIVSLGNNHILNFGRDGLAQTKNYLTQAGVDYFGAADYPKSIATEINGIKIAFVNYNEFSDLKGAEIPTTLNEIQKAKQYANIVIIYCHWGAEYQLKSSEAQRDLARQFIDAGADAVIGSHPHVIQEWEEYKNKKIYYSLGNFIFDQYFDENVRRGLGITAEIDKTTKQIKFTEINFYLDSNGQTVLK